MASPGKSKYPRVRASQVLVELLAVREECRAALESCDPAFVTDWSNLGACCDTFVQLLMRIGAEVELGRVDRQRIIVDLNES